MVQEVCELINLRLSEAAAARHAQRPIPPLYMKLTREADEQVYRDVVKLAPHALGQPIEFLILNFRDAVFWNAEG